MPTEREREAARDPEPSRIPPDKPPGAEAYGAAGAEPHADEPIAARVAREEPEDTGERDRDGRWDADEDGPAEEAALHVVDEALGDFDSDVDDPDLEAAWELDPEVER